MIHVPVVVVVGSAGWTQATISDEVKWKQWKKNERQCKKIWWNM